MQNDNSIFTGLTYQEKCYMDKLRIQEFQWLSDAEFEADIEAKYGNDLTATIKKAYGETGDDDGLEYLDASKPTIEGMDALFSCADDGEDDD